MVELFDNLPGGMIVFHADPPYKVRYVNEAFAENLGFSKEDILTADERDNRRIYEEDIPLVRMVFTEARAKGVSGEYELRFRTSRGVYQWYVCKVSCVEDATEGRLFIMSIWDIEERKQVEEELFVQMERYRLLENITGELPFDYDVVSGECFIARKYLAMRGINSIEHFARRSEMESYIHIQDIHRFQMTMDQASGRESQGSIDLRLDVSTPGESERYAWYRLTYKSILGMNGKIIRVVGRMMDIDQEKQEQEQLSQQAKKDPLTGLLNKAATRGEVAEYLRKCQDKSHAMLVIDIDNFKMINDTFGHLFGDSVLVDIAEKIVASFRTSDIVGRVGGDEFLVFMKEVESQIVEDKARLLCEKIKQQYQEDDLSVDISCSVGIAFFNQDGSNYDKLFERADYAMYQAKSAGKNQYRFTDHVGREAGFIRRKASGRQDRDAHSREQDENFLSAAFSLLTYSRNINNSLNLLLERIGKRYNLDVVAVLEDVRGTKEFIQTNCWKRGSGIVNDPVYQGSYEEWGSYIPDFDDRGILAVDDYDSEEWKGKSVRLRSGRHIRSLINCRFQSRDDRRGMVTYCMLSQTRGWSEYEKENFQKISKIIAVFVSLKSSQMELQNTIQDLTRRDRLTGLLNDKAFREEAQAILNSMDQRLQYAMVYTDIRDFSCINENYGVDVGSRVLRDCATAIASASMVLSGRLHADLFVSLIWEKDRKTILHMVESTSKLFMNVQRKKRSMDNLCLIAGIYFIEKPGEDVETAIENANLVRKKIKQDTNGAAVQIYTPDLREQRETENRILTEFDKALVENRLKIYIQPKFLLKSMETVGGEALARWVRKDGSMEPPSVFVPVLERSGHVVRLDFYVLEQLLKYMQKWKNEGKKLQKISVNFSRKHFEGRGIHNKISRLADQYGIEHKYIEVEITESLLASGLESVLKEVALLRKDGFDVAIDDFGTGYSSLSILKDIPADVVKMDKSFLEKSNIERDWDFIVKIGALIRSVKEEVIFEGVETKQQAEFLVKCGFRYGQGYLYDRPLPVDVFEEKYIK